MSQFGYYGKQPSNTQGGNTGVFDVSDIEYLETQNNWRTQGVPIEYVGVAGGGSGGIGGGGAGGGGENGAAGGGGAGGLRTSSPEGPGGPGSPTESAITVAPGAPADQAGIKPGDVLVNPGNRIKDQYREGTVINIQIIRNGITMNMRVTIGKICYDN